MNTPMGRQMPVSPSGYITMSQSRDHFCVSRSGDTTLFQRDTVICLPNGWHVYVIPTTLTCRHQIGGQHPDLVTVSQSENFSQLSIAVIKKWWLLSLEFYKLRDGISAPLRYKGTHTTRIILILKWSSTILYQYPHPFFKIQSILCRVLVVLCLSLLLILCFSVA